MKNKPVIVLLNKLDLFKAKLTNAASRESFTTCFPEYNGSLEWEPCLNHIKQ
jgi:hypothetical protein